MNISIGIPFKEVENHFTRQGSREEVVHLSSALKALAVSLFKIANDIARAKGGEIPFEDEEETILGKEIKGSYTNVIGLPTQSLYEELRKLNIEPNLI